MNCKNCGKKIYGYKPMDGLCRKCFENRAVSYIEEDDGLSGEPINQPTQNNTMELLKQAGDLSKNRR
jgi:hypothetical protein